MKTIGLESFIRYKDFRSKTFVKIEQKELVLIIRNSLSECNKKMNCFRFVLFCNKMGVESNGANAPAITPMKANENNDTILTEPEKTPYSEHNSAEKNVTFCGEFLTPKSQLDRNSPSGSSDLSFELIDDDDFKADEHDRPMIGYPSNVSVSEAVSTMIEDATSTQFEENLLDGYSEASNPEATRAELKSIIGKKNNNVEIENEPDKNQDRQCVNKQLLTATSIAEENDNSFEIEDESRFCALAENEDIEDELTEKLKLNEISEIASHSKNEAPNDESVTGVSKASLIEEDFSITDGNVADKWVVKMPSCRFSNVAENEENEPEETRLIVSSNNFQKDFHFKFTGEKSKFGSSISYLNEELSNVDENVSRSPKVETEYNTCEADENESTGQVLPADNSRSDFEVEKTCDSQIGMSVLNSIGEGVSAAEGKVQDIAKVKVQLKCTVAQKIDDENDICEIIVLHEVCKNGVPSERSELTESCGPEIEVLYSSNNHKDLLNKCFRIAPEDSCYNDFPELPETEQLCNQMAESVVENSVQPAFWGTKDRYRSSYSKKSSCADKIGGRDFVDRVEPVVKVKQMNSDGILTSCSEKADLEKRKLELKSKSLEEEDITEFDMDQPLSKNCEVHTVDDKTEDACGDLDFVKAEEMKAPDQASGSICLDSEVKPELIEIVERSSEVQNSSSNGISTKSKSAKYAWELAFDLNSNIFKHRSFESEDYKSKLKTLKETVDVAEDKRQERESEKAGKLINETIVSKVPCRMQTSTPIGMYPVKPYKTQSPLAEWCSNCHCIMGSGFCSLCTKLTEKYNETVEQAPAVSKNHPIPLNEQGRDQAPPRNKINYMAGWDNHRFHVSPIKASENEGEDSDNNRVKRFEDDFGFCDLLNAPKKSKQPFYSYYDHSGKPGPSSALKEKQARMNERSAKVDKIEQQKAEDFIAKIDLNKNFDVGNKAENFIQLDGPFDYPDLQPIETEASQQMNEHIVASFKTVSRERQEEANSNLLKSGNGSSKFDECLSAMLYNYSKVMMQSGGDQEVVSAWLRRSLLVTGGISHRDLADLEKKIANEFQTPHVPPNTPVAQIKLQRSGHDGKSKPENESYLSNLESEMRPDLKVDTSENFKPDSLQGSDEGPSMLGFQKGTHQSLNVQSSQCQVLGSNRADYDIEGEEMHLFCLVCSKNMPARWYMISKSPYCNHFCSVCHCCFLSIVRRNWVRQSHGLFIPSCVYCVKPDYDDIYDFSPENQKRLMLFKRWLARNVSDYLHIELEEDKIVKDLIEKFNTSTR